MFSDKNGILTIKPKNLVPGEKYIFTEDYELVDLKEEKEDAAVQTSTQTPASFNVTIQPNPGKNLDMNGCTTQ